MCADLGLGGNRYQPFRVAERFFFEIVQRSGYDAYGALNAPARMASQEQRDERIEPGGPP